MIKLSAHEMAVALGLKHFREGYTGPCPCCGYKTGFTLTEKQGKLLFYCHAGLCSGAEIVDTFRNLALWPSDNYQKFAQTTPANFAIVATSRADDKNTATKDRDTRDKVALGRYLEDLWIKSLPAQGSPVEAYLRSRHISCLPPSNIRYLPNGKHPRSGKTHPVMLAKVTLFDDTRLIALHRTYLKQDGSGKAEIEPVKMSLGPIRGGSVHITEPNETLALAEGIETALSVWQETSLPTWAALSTGGLKNLRLPDRIQNLIIFADFDRPGLNAAYTTAESWSRRGKSVKVIRPTSRNTDFNDVLREASL